MKDETGADLGAANVLVLRTYEEVATKGGGMATLLVNQELRQEYELVHAEIEAARAVFLKAVKVQAKTKREVDREISSSFTPSGDQLDQALKRIKDELASQGDAPFANVPYDVVMDEKVQAFLSAGNFHIAIDDYVKKYNELLAASKYFKKGAFNYYNGAMVAAQLKKNGFFDAKHTVNLNADECVEITSEAQFEELIKQEKERISGDADLRKKFEVLEKQIHKNETLRDFGAYLQDHEELLPELSNMTVLKEKLWKSYIHANYELYLSLLDKMQTADARSKQIEEQAAHEETLWQKVIDIFNDRFLVPFRLDVANKIKVQLGQESALRLAFVFKDSSEEALVDRSALLQVLSTGEKKAFYLLNMLFDIEARRLSGNETLVIVDDIADSFDYKNKYAIVQYLADLAEDPLFKILILTHNFDFYRTIESRKLVQRKNCFMVSKTDQGVSLRDAVGVKNIFVNVWRPGFFANRQMKICCIPFMRNLIEYTKDSSDPDYLRLTSLLHWKADSDQITVAELDAIYGRLFSVTGNSVNATELLLDLIDAEANACLQTPDGINFENKVILAIATRVRAEKYMAAKINDAAWLALIDGNQTPVILKRYCQEFPAEVATIKILKRVTLMTPENIHLNSFMYEPILDMSDQHLRRLYMNVIELE